MECFASSGQLVSCLGTMPVQMKFLVFSPLLLMGGLTLLAFYLYLRSGHQQKAMVQKISKLSEHHETALQGHSTLSTELVAAKASLSDQGSGLDNIQQPENDKERIRLIRKAYSEDAHKFWTRKTGQPRPDSYWHKMRGSIPVMLFTNARSGTGTTTVAANLAATYARLGEKVLVVDLDYQGNLSAMMRSESGRKPEQNKRFPSSVERVLGKELPANWADIAILDVCKNLDYISASWSLEHFERSMVYSWLLGDDGDDIRFRLSRALLTDAVQSHYDRIILDCPSRLDTAFVNGFCAATHIFVPSGSSPYALNSLIQTTRTIAALKPLNQVVRFSGIIPVQTRSSENNDALSGAEGAEEFQRAFSLENSSHLVGKAVIPGLESLGLPVEKGMAGLKDKAARKAFSVLAGEVSGCAPAIKKDIAA